MKARAHEPQRLDVAAFAEDAARLQGRWPLHTFGRLQAAVPPDAPAEAGDVEWSAEGERRRPGAVVPQHWLHLRAGAQVWLQCQRCLQPVRCTLAVDRSLRFVAGEDAAARLDADSEDDVLELTSSVDLHTLVEDELLLELPLVPRHDICPEPLPLPAEEPDAAESPFAALEALKRRGQAQ